MSLSRARYAGIISCGLTLLFSSPAMADGSELDRTYLKAGMAVRTLERMTRCLVELRPELARKQFEYNPATVEYGQVRNQFYENADRCLTLTYALGTSSEMGRGALAEALIAIDGPLRIVSPPVVSEFSGGGAYRWSWRTLTEDMKTQSQWLANCLVARHGEQAERLLASRLSSLPERAVFNAMGAELSDCIPASETWTLNPDYLRKSIAVSYYLAARASRRTGDTQ